MTQPTYHHHVQQGTNEWHNMRLGLLTASNVRQIMTTAGKPANNDKTRALAWELAAQRISGRVEDCYISDAMVRGQVEEELARDLYSKTVATVTTCGFVTREIDGVMIGYSPDGLVGPCGIIEIKSRRHRYQIETIATNEVPDEYMAQIQTGLLVTGRDYCDFVSYSGGLPMFWKPVFPDKKYQAAIIKAAQDLEERIGDILSRYYDNRAGLPDTPLTPGDQDIRI